MQNKVHILGNIFLLMLSVVLCFLGYEAYLRITSSYIFNPTTAVGMQIYRADDDLGWAHEPGAVIDDYHGEALRIDESGHRIAPIYAFAPTGNTTTTLLLGDSFTFGMNVAQSKIFPSLLQQATGVKIANEGTIGYTTDQHAAYLYHFLQQYPKPDLVILNFFVGNDVTELRRHSVTAWDDNLPIAVEDSEVGVAPDGSLISKRNVPWSYALHDIRRRLSHLFTDKQKPTLTWPVFLSPDHPQQDPDLAKYWSDTKQYLLAIQHFLDENNIPLLVTLVPMDVQVSHVYWDKYPDMPFDDEAFVAKRPQTRLTDFLERHNIDYLDLLPIFQEHALCERLYFAVEDLHLTEIGHEVMAEVLFQYLEDEYAIF